MIKEFILNHQKSIWQQSKRSKKVLHLNLDPYNLNDFATLESKILWQSSTIMNKGREFNYQITKITNLFCFIDHFIEKGTFSSNLGFKTR